MQAVRRTQGAGNVVGSGRSLEPLASTPLTDGLVMHRRATLFIALAETHERRVELIEALALGDRTEDVVLDEAAGSLDAAFLVAFARCSELNGESQGAAELPEGLVLLTIATTQDFGDGDLGVVENANSGKAAEVHDGAQETGEERRLISAQRDAREQFAAVTQARDEQLHNREHATEDEFDWREVELHLVAGHVESSHEDLFGNDFPSTIGHVFTQRSLADLQILVHAFV